MARTYYSDYVGHMMRQYIRLKDSDETIAEGPTEQNVNVCGLILDGLPENERTMLTQIYANKVIANEIEGIAESQGLRPQNIWAIVKNFEREIAKERGLL